jgi:hypothetical protein
MTNKQKREALKEMLLFQAELNAENQAKEYKQDDINTLLTSKPHIKLVYSNGVKV